MSPNSKFILDSDATIAIYSFYTERLEAELQLDHRIAHYFSEAHPAGLVFKMLLSYQKNKEAREQRFRELQDQLYAVALKKDDVIPANEVLNTLKGDYRDIGTRVKVMDFPFNYTHINPFPIDAAIEQLVDKSFTEVFEMAAGYLCS
jgi:alcohol dehydrogenase YqhD (iron-dependent ADH family)